MPKQVNGFLAEDGTFFEHEPECKRYEHMKTLEVLCVTYELNFENFLEILNAWHEPIRSYFNADEACEARQTYRTVGYAPKFNGSATLLRTEDDSPDVASGDKDAPGFLEQQIRRNI